MLDLRKWLREKLLADFSRAVVEWSDSRGMFRITFPGEVSVEHMHPALRQKGILCVQTPEKTVIMISAMSLAILATPKEEREHGGPVPRNIGAAPGGPWVKRGPRMIRAHGRVTEEVYGTPVATPSTPFDGAFRLDAMEGRKKTAGVVDYEMDGIGGGVSGKSYAELLKDPDRRR